MENVNQDYLRKAITTATFTLSGTLNAHQQKNFITYVKNFSTFLGLCRVIQMPQPSMDIDKLWINRPITRKHTEWSSASAAGAATVVSNKVSLAAKKAKSYWYITHESLKNNIEQNSLVNTLQSMLMKQITTDFENLLINGDTVAYASDSTDTGWLLRTADGILTRAEEGHVHTFSGETIGRNTFRELRKRLPRQYLSTRGLMFFIPDSLFVDFCDKLANRGTPIGDAALQGNVISPYGYPIVRAELLPDTRNLDVTAATSAFVRGTAFGPVAITSTTNMFKIDVDNIAAVTITLTTGNRTISEIANEINAAIYANVTYAALPQKELYRNIARDDGTGKLILESPTTGTTSEIDVQAQANNAYTALGLSIAVTAGTNSGTHTTVQEGGVCLFTNPMNLIFGVLDGTRIYSEYNNDLDGLETWVYNEVDVQIENTDGLALGVDIRVNPD